MVTVIKVTRNPAKRQSSRVCEMDPEFRTDGEVRVPLLN